MVLPTMFAHQHLLFQDPEGKTGSRDEDTLRLLNDADDNDNELFWYDR